MFEVTIDKLPGGDASRRTCLARITLTNTGEGGDGARTYAVRITHAEERARAGVSADSCRTYRERDEQVLRLVHRALGRLLGDGTR
jgi:hypothetical protein